MSDTVTLGGRDFDLPPLSCGEFEELWPIITAANEDPFKTVAGFRKVVSCAVKKKSPEVDENWLRANASIPELQAAMVKVMASSGFKAPNSGEAKSP